MAMTCINEERKYGAPGTDIRQVLIVADTTPAALPTTGAGVDRLPDTVTLDIGSVLLDLQASTKHILGGDGWHVWSN